MAGTPPPDAAVRPSTPPLPLKTRILIAALSATTATVTRANGTINRRLLRLLDPAVAASSKPSGGARTADITVDHARGLWFRLFVPVISSGRAASGGERIPVVLFFHGGGFNFLSAGSRSYDAVCRRICSNTGALLVSVNYRLAPEHRHPACYEDGEDVLRFLDSGGLDAVDAAAAGMADLSSCFVAGDSAGGNIAHHVTRRWAAAPTSWKRVKLAGLVAIQPFFGGEERTESELRLAEGPIVTLKRTDFCWMSFLPEGADRDHEAANVFGPRGAGELEAAFPPTLVVVTGFDPLQDWQRRYYEGLKARGKEAEMAEYPNSIHAFYVFPELKEAGELMEEMTLFINKYKSK